MGIQKDTFFKLTNRSGSSEGDEMKKYLDKIEKFKQEFKERFRKIMNKETFFLLDLCKLLILDIFDRKKTRKKLYGVDGIVGTWGSGKTVSMVNMYLELKKEHPEALYISNFGLDGTSAFVDIDDVVERYKYCTENDINLVVFWDEIQNEFPESDRNFNPMFRLLLTQNRKNAGVYFVWSTQDYTRVNKNIRLMSRYISHCRTFFNRLTRIKQYNRDDYDMYYSAVNVDRKLKVDSRRTKYFLQYDYIRNMYDSFAMLEHVKKKVFESEKVS